MIVLCGCIYACTYKYICVFDQANVYVCSVCVDICLFVSM